MYEKEEEKLDELRQQLEHVNIPTEMVDGAILQGFERAKREKVRKKKRRIRYFGMIAAALLLITMATSIRVSPAFANAVSAIPGLEKIVAMIHYDKGLTSAFENDYFQKINASQTKGDLTLTVDGVILDESGINVFYTVKSDETIKNVRVQNVELKNNEISQPSSSSFSVTHDDQSIKEFSNKIDFHFQEPTKFSDLSFSLLMTIDQAGTVNEFTIPFTVPENVKPSHKFVLSKEVEIKKQKFTIEEVTIHPLRVDVRISLNPENSKKILNFTDLRLEDENGEIWGSRGGISGSGVGELEQTIYLQSNYFEQPKKLYLRVNKLQAINQDEAIVVVDTEKNILLNSPRDGRLQLGDTNKKQANFFLTQAEEQDYSFDLTSKIQDTEGKIIHSPSSSMRYDAGKMESYSSINFETTDYKNPLQFELSAYPNYIEGDVKLELKNPIK
ncbi:DUF4179 domain-containing protein [Paenisporosarcina quisquiliarum]|uniref:DUF4179 domain-containing protein n=1 Tax=Paenisporosarcina quisquiliarum TaxID=365346 RepID=A0A9X3LGH8_9BACL|nr:DUF4179 domain-containing protein [Paenisporosarcina quisquiliarum]MCZ8537461.1 DUF4179 domain-containing protein [Paenisporosarcina quisquiliarum]